MRPQARPFSVEIKRARARSDVPLSSAVPEWHEAQAAADPVPKGARAPSDSLAEAYAFASQVFGGEVRGAAPDSDTQIGEPALTQPGRPAPRILPDLREQAQAAASATALSSGSPVERRRVLDAGVAVQQDNTTEPRRKQPTRARSSSEPGVKSRRKTAFDETAWATGPNDTADGFRTAEAGASPRDPESGPAQTGATASSTTRLQARVQAALRLDARSATSNLPRAERWKERRLPRVCWSKRRG